MKQNIQIKQWLDLKPYDKYKKTDSYYLKLSNTVHHALIKNTHTLVLRNHLPKFEIEILACFLTSYFEDIISKTYIWSSFVDSHQKLYKKILPFYPTEEYNHHNINLQDICFLMWYFVNSTDDDVFISPAHEFLIEISNSVCEIFIESHPYAPKNKDLKSYYHLDSNETDYYVIRKKIDTILFKTYLFYPDTVLDFRQQITEIASEFQYDENLIAHLNDFRDNSLHKTCTQLLSLNGKQWLAEVIADEHPLYQDVLSISQRIKGLFLYKGQDSENIFIQHIESDKRFEMTKQSFDSTEMLETIDTILQIGIVLWKDKWWFTGVFFQQPYDEDTVAKEKQSIQSRNDAGFLDHSTKKLQDLLAKHCNAFKKFNNNQLIAFLPSEKINDFYEEYIQYFNSLLSISTKQKRQLKHIEKTRNSSNLIKGKINFEEFSESGLVFFNPKGGIEIALNVNSAFPLPNNHYFDAELSEEHIIQMMTDPSISTELVNYCMDNCKTNLPFFDSIIGQSICNDLDFLLRYWKKEKYHTVPSLSFTD